MTNTIPVDDRAILLALLREREGAPDEAQLLHELVGELRASRDALAGRVQTADIELSSITVVRVQVASTPPKGGDAGHGAFTRLRLTDEAGSCWSLVVEEHDGTMHQFEPRSFQLMVNGDDEQGQLLAALQIAVQVMRQASVEPTSL